jgi:hypothetical protein
MTSWFEKGLDKSKSLSQAGEGVELSLPTCIGAKSNQGLYWGRRAHALDTHERSPHGGRGRSIDESRSDRIESGRDTRSGGVGVRYFIR